MAVHDVVLMHKRVTSNMNRMALDFDTSAGSILTLESIVQEPREHRSEWALEWKPTEDRLDALTYAEKLAAYCSVFSMDYQRPFGGDTAILQLAVWLSTRLMSQRVLASEVPEEVAAAVESNSILRECFWTVLSALKVGLEWSEVCSFRIRKLVDPEGSGLRIQFEVGTDGWTRDERRSLRRELRQVVDTAVRRVISSHGLGETDYIDSRVVFGVSVGVEAGED